VVEFHENGSVAFDALASQRPDFPASALRVDRVIGGDSPCRSEVSGEFDAAADEDHRA
jgi:hypothetical protein